MQTVWIEQYYKPSQRPERLPVCDVTDGIIQALKDGCQTATDIGFAVGRTRKIITVRLNAMRDEGIVHGESKKGTPTKWTLLQPEKITKTQRDGEYIEAIKSGVNTSVALRELFGISAQNVLKRIRRLQRAGKIKNTKRTRDSGGLENVWSVV